MHEPLYYTLTTDEPVRLIKACNGGPNVPVQPGLMTEAEVEAVAWLQKPGAPKRLPADWTPAIAEWPVVVVTVFGFVWGWSKRRYLSAVGSDPIEADQLVPWFADLLAQYRRSLIASPFYHQFVEQLNEQKEMLVAMALLIYAIYRVIGTRSGDDPVTTPA